jgi:KaiC/GvpD/RAD55 family RecA-like ATPase
MAARAGDDAGAAKALQVDGQLREGLLQGVIRHMQFDGTGALYAKPAIEEIVRTSATDALRRGRARYAHDVMMNLGRPADARRYLAMSRDSANDLNVRIILVRDAILGEGDQASAMEAAQSLAKIEAEPAPTDSAGLQIRRAVTRVLEPWRVMRGDTSQTRRSIARLRAIARAQPKVDSAQAQLEIAYLEMLYAMASKASNLRVLAQRMDSMFLDQQFAGVHTGRTSQHAIALGRAWEQLGEPRRALSAVMRFSNWNTEVMPYLGAQVRETARTAVRAGDKKRAIRSYNQYLGMRAVAEPSYKPEIDSVRAELARISR